MSGISQVLRPGAGAFPDLPVPDPGELLDRLAPVAAADPSRAVVAVTAALAFLAVASGPGWRTLRHVVTIAHEGGHAAAAALVGRRLHGVRLHSDTSGLTVSAGRPTGPGVVFTLLAGYLAPAVLGLVASVVLRTGWVAPVLWGTVALLAALLVVIRNVFGVVSILLTAGALGGVAWFAPVWWQTPAAYLLTWFLLIAAPRPVLELRVSRRRRLAPGSDADQLARLTALPAGFWVAFFLVGTLACLGGGAWALVS